MDFNRPKALDAGFEVIGLGDLGKVGLGLLYFAFELGFLLLHLVDFFYEIFIVAD